MRWKLLVPWFLVVALWGGPPVLFLSFDGLAARSFNQRTMPRLWKLAEQGRRGEGLPPFPSTTFNGHATLATGCWPEHHGIVANAFVDPARGFVSYASEAGLLQREPLWVAATRSGLKAAVYHWPCATGPWESVNPWRMEIYHSRRPDVEAMAFCERSLGDGADLVMAYFTGIDEEGHTHGPGSPEVLRKLSKVDEETAPWLERMLAEHKDLRVVLVADHGMADLKRRIHLPSLLKGCFTRILAHGGSAYVYVKPGRVQEAKKRLKAVGLEVWSRQDLPLAFHLGGSERVGDLVVQAATGTWLAESSGPAAIEERKGRQGAHAYSSDRPEMHTWLVVLGAGRGELGDVPLWDLAPTIAKWMGIRWALEPDGKPIQVLP